MKTIIPLYNEDEAYKYVEDQIKTRLNLNGSNTQAMYDELVKIIYETGSKFGKMKINEQTDDKLSPHTKALINERERLRRVDKPTKELKVELTELSKLIKREIRKDIKNFEEITTREIIEESGSTRMVKKALSRGVGIVNKLKDSNGVIRTGKDNELKIASHFYEQLYRSKDPQQNMVSNTQNTQSQERGAATPFPHIMSKEMEHTVNNMKINRAPGPAKIENKTLKQISAALNKPLTALFNNTTQQWKKGRVRNRRFQKYFQR